MSFAFYQIEVGWFQNFNYVLYDTDTKEAALIDPAFEVDRLEKFVIENNLKVTQILLTHSHDDHVEGLPLALQTFGEDLPVIVHPAQADRIKDVGAKMQLVHGGEIIKIGNISGKIYHTPGHQEGSLCYEFPGHLVTGDTLFVGYVGRTNFERSSNEGMYDSIYNVLFKIPDDTVVLCGHNYGKTPLTTIGDEKKTNPWFGYQGRKADFVKAKSEYDAKRA